MSETVVLVLRAFIPLGIMGLVFGGLLGFAGKIFAVEQDPRIADVMNALPAPTAAPADMPAVPHLRRRL